MSNGNGGYNEQGPLDSDDWRWNNGELVFGDPADPRNFIEFTLDRQSITLEEHGANDQTLIVATRQHMDRSNPRDALAASMAIAFPLVGYLSQRFELPLRDTLDFLNAQYGQVATTSRGLRDAWRQIYLQGSGSFHLQRFSESLDPRVLAGRADYYVAGAQANLSAHPVAMLNCLNQVRLFTHSRPIEGTLVSGRGELDEAQLVAFEGAALQILASQHISDRPYATWYLLARSSLLRRNVAAILSPLLMSITTAEEAPTLQAQQALNLLDSLNSAVAAVVGEDWDSWQHQLLYFDFADEDGRVKGALEYGKTALHRSGQSRRSKDYSNYTNEQLAHNKVARQYVAIIHQLLERLVSD